MDYQDFVIRLEPGAPGIWTARVVESPLGEGKEIVELEIDLELWTRLWLSQADRVRQPRGLETAEEAAGAPSLEELPPLLFRALFSGEALRLWDRSVGAAAPGGLRLHLRFDAGEAEIGPLLPLPWELAQDPMTRSFHGPSALTPMLRYLEVPRSRPRGAVPRPLRVLLVSPAPGDAPGLAVAEEAEAVREAFRGRVEVVIETLGKPTLRNLLNALRRASNEESGEGFHVLHFMGHGDFDPATGEGFLLFETDGRETHRVSGESLAAQLEDFQHTLRLVVVNACHGGAQ